MSEVNLKLVLSDGPLLQIGYAVVFGEGEGGPETDPIASAALATHAARTDNPHAVTKTQVGLGNANDTSDANKPVSTAQAAALAAKLEKVSPFNAGTKIVFETDGSITIESPVGIKIRNTTTGDEVQY